MIWTFDVLVIPNSDKYLAEKYSAAFDDYAATTAVLIPFLPRPALHVLAWAGLAACVYFGMQCPGACA